MKKTKLLTLAFINSLGVFIYTALVAWVMFNAQKFLSNGKPDTFLAPLTVLLLFVVSATIIGTLVLGRPIYLYLNNSKSEAVKLFLYTVGFLILITVLTIVFMAGSSK